MRIYLTTLFIALTSYIFAQPFLDIVNIRISGFQGNSPFVESDKPIKQQNTCNASLNLPLFIDSANLILLSPGYEIRNLQENEFTHYLFEGFDFPVTYVHTFSLANARISATILPRYAGCDGIAWNTNSMLLGGAGLYSKTINHHFIWKAGVYYNREFFGNVWLPLLGVDWWISDRVKFWVLLPRYLYFDYKLSKQLHSGFAYRGLEDSFRQRPDQSYYHFREGQMRLYIDYYIPHSRFVVNISAGETAGRDYFIFNQRNNPVEMQDHIRESILYSVGISYRYITERSFK